MLRTDGPQLTRFWDVSAKRSYAMTLLARSLRGIDVDIAQSFGLFCDVGIPLLMHRFPDYGRTLKASNDDTDRSFTEVEQASHQTDHALIGAIMGRSWGISQTVCLAIRLHHDYAIFRDPHVPDSVARLIAMGLLAEVAIQRFAGLNESTEWKKAVIRLQGHWCFPTPMLKNGSSGWSKALRLASREPMRRSTQAPTSSRLHPSKASPPPPRDGVAAHSRCGN